MSKKALVRPSMAPRLYSFFHVGQRCICKDYLMLKKKWLSRKITKKKTDATFPVHLKKKFFNVRNPLVYRRWERNTNRFVMKEFENCKEFTLM